MRLAQRWALPCALLIGAAGCDRVPPDEEADPKATLSRADPRTPEIAERGVAAPAAAGSSDRTLKLRRHLEGPAFARFKIRHGGKVKHYAGLATRSALSSQILFQLFRDAEVDKARKARRERTAAVPRVIGQRGYVDHHRSVRRHAYRTSYFAELKAQGRAAFADIEVALFRSLPKAERVELLKLLNALARGGQEVVSAEAARDIFLAYALRPFDPEEQDYTPHLAFAYYWRLEARESDRTRNRARFVATSHAPITAGLEKRLSSGDLYRAVRGRGG